MIYLDHAATCPMLPPVWERMQTLVGEADFNPASLHSAGGRAAAALEQARAEIARSIGVARSEIIFTAGGTQSDNLAVLGFARANGGRARILVSAVEHKAVLEAAGRAEWEGCAVEVLPVDASGRVDPAILDERLTASSGQPTLVSVMWANSEVGTVQPIEELCAIAACQTAKKWHPARPVLKRRARDPAVEPGVKRPRAVAGAGECHQTRVATSPAGATLRACRLTICASIASPGQDGIEAIAPLRMSW